MFFVQSRFVGMEPASREVAGGPANAVHGHGGLSFYCCCCAGLARRSMTQQDIEGC